MWNEHEIDITKKTSNSYEVKADDILRAASAAAKQPSAYLPDSQFLQLRVRYHLELQKSVKDAFARIRLSLYCTKPRKAGRNSSRKMAVKC
jgi:uncharacterized membrane protein